MDEGRRPISSHTFFILARKPSRTADHFMPFIQLDAFVPFVHALYGAIYSQPEHLPIGLRYTAQIQQSVEWIQVFLRGRQQDLVRTMHVDAH